MTSHLANGRCGARIPARHSCVRHSFRAKLVLRSSLLLRNREEVSGSAHDHEIAG